MIEPRSEGERRTGEATARHLFARNPFTPFNGMDFAAGVGARLSTRPTRREVDETRDPRDESRERPRPRGQRFGLRSHESERGTKPPTWVPRHSHCICIYPKLVEKILKLRFFHGFFARKSYNGSHCLYTAAIGFGIACRGFVQRRDERAMREPRPPAPPPYISWLDTAAVPEKA